MHAPSADRAPDKLIDLRARSDNVLTLRISTAAFEVTLSLHSGKSFVEQIAA